MQFGATALMLAISNKHETTAAELMQATKLAGAAVGNLSAADALLHARLAPGRRRVFLTVTSCGVFALRPLGAT